MKNTIAKCKDCGKDFVMKSKVNWFCTTECCTSFHLKRNNPYYITKFKVLERDNFTCIYCGQSSIEHNIELQTDHIVPCRGDRNDTHFSNLVTSCVTCNQSKGGRNLSEEMIARIKQEINKRNALKGLPMEI